MVLRAIFASVSLEQWDRRQEKMVITSNSFRVNLCVVEFLSPFCLLRVEEEALVCFEM